MPPHPPARSSRMSALVRIKQSQYMECREQQQCPIDTPDLTDMPCIDGKAGPFECKDVNLLSFVSLSSLGSNGDGNDIWGWTDPQTGKEYALAGCVDGISFVDVTDPYNPVVLGFLRTHTFSSIWRGVKVSKRTTKLGLALNMTISQGH